MKKYFTLLLMALITLGANAAKQSLPLDNLNAGWGSSYDAATHTITFEDSWKGRGWGYWSNSADYSAYDEICIEFEPTDMKVKVQVEYNDENGTKLDGVSSASELVEAGATSVSVKLDAEHKAYVNQIYIQTDAAGTLVLKDAYLYKEGDVELPQTKDLFNDFKGVGTLADGVITIDATAKEWGWFSKWYGDQDFSAFDYVILELAEASAFNIQVSVQTVDAPDAKGMLNAGELVLTMPLPETKNHVKCIALQNAEIGSFKVKAIYLATEKYVSETTGVSAVKTPIADNGAAYNIGGQRVDAGYKGIVVRKGKKFIFK